MFMQILSLVALCGCCLVALRWGGRDERLAALGFVIAAIATPLFNSDHYGQTEIGVLIVDASLLIGLLVIALNSDRFWPMWAAGFQAVGTTVHMASLAQTGDFAKAYGNALVFWFYPVVIALMLGTWLEARRRNG